MLKCHYPQCHYVEYHFAIFADCHLVERHYIECRGAIVIPSIFANCVAKSSILESFKLLENKTKKFYCQILILNAFKEHLQVDDNSGCKNLFVL